MFTKSSCIWGLPLPPYRLHRFWGDLIKLDVCASYKLTFCFCQLLPQNVEVVSDIKVFCYINLLTRSRTHGGEGGLLAAVDILWTYHSLCNACAPHTGLIRNLIHYVPIAVAQFSLVHRGPRVTAGRSVVEIRGHGGVTYSVLTTMYALSIFYSSYIL